MFRGRSSIMETGTEGYFRMLHAAYDSILQRTRDMVIDTDFHYSEELTLDAHCKRAVQCNFTPLNKYQFNLLIDSIVMQEIAEITESNRKVYKH